MTQQKLTYEVYTDGACKGNPGPGGWGVVVVSPDGHRTRLSGRKERTTNQQMELRAAIEGLEVTPEGAHVTVHSDSTYLVNTMTHNWKRRANLDLWANLDTLAEARTVRWEWVRGHAGHPENEEANALAQQEAGTAKGRPPSEETPALTHLDEQGRARMVDVGWKGETEREAVAKGSVVMTPETLRLITEGGLEKGDALGVARLAGVMGAKLTPQLIPLSHPIPLDQVMVELEADEKASAIHITATAKATARTGVEMEALVAVTTAALTLYDMAKAVDRRMRIQDVRLVRKRGGKSGEIVLE